MGGRVIVATPVLVLAALGAGCGSAHPVVVGSPAEVEAAALAEPLRAVGERSAAIRAALAAEPPDQPALDRAVREIQALLRTEVFAANPVARGELRAKFLFVAGGPPGERAAVFEECQQLLSRHWPGYAPPPRPE